MATPTYIYFLLSDSGYLYIGVTNDLMRRLAEHRSGNPSSCASRNRAVRLVYWEPWDGPLRAIAREKQLKRWSRGKKDLLLAIANPCRIELGTADQVVVPPGGFRWSRWR